LISAAKLLTAQPLFSDWLRNVPIALIDKTEYKKSTTVLMAAADDILFLSFLRNIVFLQSEPDLKQFLWKEK